MATSKAIDLTPAVRRVREMRLAQKLPLQIPEPDRLGRLARLLVKP